jgi:hypothetical protein
MQMPGFTAEASMYRTKNVYQSSTAVGFARDGNAGVLRKIAGLDEGFCVEP